MHYVGGSKIARIARDSALSAPHPMLVSGLSVGGFESIEIIHRDWVHLRLTRLPNLGANLMVGLKGRLGNLEQFRLRDR